MDTIADKNLSGNLLLRRVLIFAFSAIAFILLFSPSTSPLYPQFFGADSAIFQVIGKGWTMGQLPYRDLFDHKGPFIFLINAIGYTIGAVWIVQVLFMTFTLLGIYDILSQSTVSERWKIAFSVLSLFILLKYFEGGNLTEEYCLPFLVWSMSKQHSYMQNTGIEHRPRYALLYGVTFGICLMTRVTNAVVVCMFIFVITVHLAKNGAWRNLAENALAFLLGTTMIVVPLVLYFAAHHAVHEMLYGTIQYNLVYAKETSLKFFSGFSLNFKALAKLCLNSFLLLFMLIAGCIELRNKNFVYAAGIFLSVMLSAYVCFGGEGYLHYSMILLPYYPVFIVVLTGDVCKRKPKRLLLLIFCTVCVAVSAWALKSSGYILKQLDGSFSSNILPAEIISEIPEAELGSVAGYNVNAATYLALDIMPKYPHFILQDWQGRKSPELMEKIREEYSSCEAKWIIAPDGGTGIDDILSNLYVIKTSYDVSGTVWNLYCLKE